MNRNVYTQHLSDRTFDVDAYAIYKVSGVSGCVVQCTNHSYIGCKQKRSCEHLLYNSFFYNTL